MPFSTFAEIEQNIVNDFLEHLKLDTINERFFLLKRDIKMMLATSNNQTKEIQKQIIRFEGKFDFENHKWYFEDRGEYALNYLRWWYKGTAKEKTLPNSVARWYNIDQDFEGMGDKMLIELYNDLSTLNWLKSLVDTPSVSKAKNDNKQPLARHWALFFAYWYDSHHKTKLTPITTALSEFHETFKPNFKVESIRVKFNNYGYTTDTQRKKNKEDIKFVIEYFLNKDPKTQKKAKNDLI